ncbi:MAG: HlyC/CorC family transporter [Chloroflexota bacterium]|nr:MAG: HlyC/CorC family transporter [Chloroflexota bacterium]
MLELLLIVLFIFINAFFAASEIAIVSARRTRLRQLAEEEANTRASIALGLLKRPTRFLATIQVGVTLAGFFISAIGAVSAAVYVSDMLATVPIPIVAGAAGPLGLAIVTVAVAFVTLVIGELVPKNLAVTYSERVALAVAWPIDLISRVMSPFIVVVTASTDAILFLLGSRERAQIPEVTEEEIRSIIEAGEEEGVVEPLERRMIQGVFDFTETRVHEVMTPRTDVIAIETTASVQDALRAFVDTGHSRMPVYRDSLDDIVGVLYAKDLLKSLGLPERDRHVLDLVRPAMFVPESKMVSELLVEFQRSKTHMAIVVDEYGGTGGIVTLEDLLEEIVGEIHDEYDVVEKRIELIEPNQALVNGKVTVDELNEALDLDLQAEGVDTVGGLILSYLGRFPTPNEEVRINGAVMTVLSVHGRRIRLVRVIKTP